MTGRYLYGHSTHRPSLDLLPPQTTPAMIWSNRKCTQPSSYPTPMIPFLYPRIGHVQTPSSDDSALSTRDRHEYGLSQERIPRTSGSRNKVGRGATLTTLYDGPKDVIQIFQHAAYEGHARGPQLGQIDGYKELIEARESAPQTVKRDRTRLVELVEKEEGSAEVRRETEAEQEVIAWKFEELSRAQGARS